MGGSGLMSRGKNTVQVAKDAILATRQEHGLLTIGVCFGIVSPLKIENDDWCVGEGTVLKVCVHDALAALVKSVEFIVSLFIVSTLFRVGRVERTIARISNGFVQIATRIRLARISVVYRDRTEVKNQARRHELKCVRPRFVV
jgi:hypothetical protein